MSEAFAQNIADLEFSQEQIAKAMWVSPHFPKSEALRAYGFSAPQPIMVVIGGASFMEPQIQEALRPFFNRVLAPLAQGLGLTVLDGGTDAGVIRMMGTARAHIRGDFPLIGVVPQGKAKIPGKENPDANVSTHNLEPNHTHFFLIPGEAWGTESPWLTDFATLLADNQPSLTVLINGGKTSLKDLRANLEAGRMAVVVSGSGRLADRIAAAISGQKANVEPEILNLIDTYGPDGKLVAIDISQPLIELFEQLKQYFVKTI